MPTPQQPTAINGQQLPDYISHPRYSPGSAIARIDLNTPTLIILAPYEQQGEPQEGQFGTDYLYHLAGEKFLYADPKLHATLQSAIKANRADGPIELCVTKSKRGNANIWTVEQIAEEPAPPPPPPPPPPPAAPARRSAPRTRAAEAPPAAPGPPLRRDPQPAATLSQAATPEDLYSPGPPLPSQRTTADARLLMAWTLAIELAAHAVQHAAKRGLEIQPNFGDVRAMAATLFLDAAKQEPRQ